MATKPPAPVPKEKPAITSNKSSEDKPPDVEKAAEKIPETLPSSPPESSDTKKKPAGAVSLFGGIDVFANKQNKSPLDKKDDSFLSDDSPPAIVKKEEKKEEKAKTKTVSLFDEDEEDEPDWNDSIFTSSKPAAENTEKV